MRFEEIVVDTETTERTEAVRDTVRRTDANVEEISGAAAAVITLSRRKNHR